MFFLTFVIISVFANKQPILTLSLALSETAQVETTFAIGHSQVRVNIDINYQSLDVCCKKTNTIPRRVFYFMANPFKSIEDYSCKNTGGPSKEADTAVFEKIGPLNIEFNEIIYPACNVGRLGFSKKSQFLSLMPSYNKFFVIEQQNQPKVKSREWKLVVGGQEEGQFSYWPTLQGVDWRMQVQIIKFNDIPFANQTLKLITDGYHIAIPTKIYSLIKHQLINNFECISKDQQIYCPCTGGISSSFPKFILQLGNFTMDIQQRSYLKQRDEVCQTLLKESQRNQWEINILFFDNVDILFDYQKQRIGLASHRKSIQKNEVPLYIFQLINEPLQVLLNSVVMLLMCFFVAMVLIELIKYILGIENASTESFETYMLKRAE